MFSLLYALLRMPPWLILVFAAGLGWLGYDFRTKHRQEVAESIEMLARPQPEPVMVTTFDPAPDGRRVVEANVIARWGYEYNTRLITTKNGQQRLDRLVVVFLDETVVDNQPPTVAGVIVVRPNDADHLLDWMVEQVQEPSSEYPLVRLEGVVVPSKKSKEVSSILDKHGLTRSPDFFYLDPFLEGREAWLTQNSQNLDLGAWVFWGPGLGLAFIAALRLASRRKRLLGPKPGARGQSAHPNARAQSFLSDTTWQAAQQKRRRGAPRNWLILGGIAALGGVTLWIGSPLASILPTGLVLLMMYGFWSMKRKVADKSILALDRLTGIAKPAATATPPAIPAYQPARSGFSSPALFDSPLKVAGRGPIVTTPDLATRVKGTLRNRRFTQWLPLISALFMFVLLGGYASGGFKGIQDRVDVILAPLIGNQSIGGTFSQTGPKPQRAAALPPQSPSGQTEDKVGPAEVPPPSAEAGAATQPDPDGPQAMRWQFLLMIGSVIMVFVFAYGRRWLNKRYGLALEEPWERLDRPDGADGRATNRHSV